jgi:two-component system CheB/CheR fusion protein
MEGAASFGPNAAGDSRMGRQKTAEENEQSSVEQLQAENGELRQRLEEAEETIRAIRTGAVDAFLVEEPDGCRVYTLEGADRPYRLLVEEMQQGAATLYADGTIAYCNRRLADLLEMRHEKLIGAALCDFIASDDLSVHENLIGQGKRRSGRGEAHLRRTDGSSVPVYLTFNALPADCGVVTGVLVTDLRSQKHHEVLAATLEKLQDAQAALVKKERQLQHVTDHAAVMVAQCSRDMRFTFVNQTCASFLDRPIEQIIGRPIAEVLGSSAFEAIRPHIERVLAGGRVEFEEEIPYAKAGRRTMRVVYVPDIDSRGDVCGWIAAITDISDRKKTEEALRASESRLSAFLEQLPLGVGATDLEGRWTISNAVMRTFMPEKAAARDPERASRWEAVDADGQPIPPHEWPSARALRGETVSSGMEMMYTGDDGRKLWTRVTSAPLRSQSGEIVGAMSVVQDIDAIKRAELALRESEERFRSLVSVITDVPWTSDSTGAFVAPQPMWTEYTGQSWDELRGFGWVNAVHPADQERVKSTWLEACRTAGVFESNGRLWHAATRQYRYFAARATPLLCPDGHVREWVGSCTDVHEQRRVEEALRDGDRRKDEFLAMLAHELRNPLAPLCNALHLVRLADANTQSGLKQACDLMERQLEHLIRLVDDLLDVSRITSGKITLQTEAADLGTIVARAVEGSRPFIDERTHMLEVTLPSEPITVEADAVRLAQVVWNLLNNAAKYTPKGGRIWVRGELEGTEAVVRVRDTGMGIAHEMLPKVFDLFTQMDRTLDRAQGGLGIGLTLVRRLTEMHGGTVIAHSEGPGHGAEFVVRLPALAGAPAAGRPTGPDRRAEGIARVSGRRILVVDDNRDSAESLAMYLRLLGNDVRTAHDGRLGLEVAASYRPDVVLLDIGLPEMSGLEVCGRMRELPGEPRPLIVALTGYGQDRDRRRTEQAGFDAHLVKPLDFGTLQELLAGTAGSGH